MVILLRLRLHRLEAVVSDNDPPRFFAAPFSALQSAFISQDTVLLDTFRPLLFFFFSF